MDVLGYAVAKSFTVVQVPTLQALSPNTVLCSPHAGVDICSYLGWSLDYSRLLKDET